MLKTSMVRAFQLGISVRQNGVQNELQRPPKRGVGSSNLPGITKNKPLTSIKSQGLFFMVWANRPPVYRPFSCPSIADRCWTVLPHLPYGCY